MNDTHHWGLKLRQKLSDFDSWSKNLIAIMHITLLHFDVLHPECFPSEMLMDEWKWRWCVLCCESETI